MHSSPENISTLEPQQAQTSEPSESKDTSLHFLQTTLTTRKPSPSLHISK